MKKFRLLLLLLLLLVGSVGAQEPDKLEPAGGVKVGQVKYFLAATQRDLALEKAIAKAFDVSSGQEVRYLYNRVSLTQGGDQALVLLPGADFSGSGGSSAAVFDHKGDGYVLVTRFTLMRTPVLVATSSSKGWRDLIVRPSGGGMPAQFSRLRFDGRGYPPNPTSVNAMTAGLTVSGTAYLATPLSPEVGLSFKAP